MGKEKKMEAGGRGGEIRLFVCLFVILYYYLRERVHIYNLGPV